MPEDFRVDVACPGFDSCPWKEPRQDRFVSPAPIKGISVGNSGYYLRPEAIESAFVLFRVTGNETYREDAWRMFEAIMRATATKYGNAAVTNINDVEKIQQQDSMESFWMAETLKYFYLIFSPPDLISLDDYVFNTEAHPFRRPSSQAPSR